MNRNQLFQQIRIKKTYLCIGLDTDITKIPVHLQKGSDPVFEFNKQIIDATQEYAVAIKPNVAFYEALGPKGWESLQKTIEYAPSSLFKIADAKRGDIGNTSQLYAKAFFDQMNCDAVTVAPYMGEDSVKPFLEFKDKWAILLAHTSNKGADDFQRLETGGSNRKLYEEVIVRSQQWGTPDNMMYVVGATQTDRIADIRKLAPDHFFLVPGIGAQGGDLKEVSKRGMNGQCGLLVNASRSILYASDGKDFAAAAGREAKKIQQEMEGLLDALL
jgi:orotidine-5'-phosphate decarboxylase